ncbi:hypothetical protein [Bdellovibrio sp. HCB-110]|uniref:hypothetical protein n=1 Tax=Bdellovibrio sp. HCB-110 TaxID=3391182 RepID=UPI0039B51AE3
MKLLAFVVSLCIAVSSSKAFANELELIFYRAPKPLNWSTPGNLIHSTLKNMRMRVDGYRYPHSISHVNVRLQCGNEPSIYRGMTATKSDPSYVWDFLGKGVALDTLMINVPGRHYTEEQILRWLPTLKAKGYVRSLKLILNDDQCARVQRYIKLYEELHLDKIYGGLRSTAHYGQGAGCAAYAVSFLQILDLFPESIDKHWRRTLLIPLELLSSQTHSARIGFFGYLRGKDRTWSSPNEKHIPLEFWDPELMYNWVGNVIKDKKNFPPHMWTEKDPKTPFQSLVWDVRSYPTSTKYFFAYRRGTLDNTVDYHIRNRNRLMTDEEILNQSPRKCRLFQPCP